MTDAYTAWLEEILAERFGHAWRILRTESTHVLMLEGAEGKVVFGRRQQSFFEPGVELPFTYWDAEAENWQSALVGPLPAPGRAELPCPLVDSSSDVVIVHYDILGLVYWMLARIEEIGCKALDSHGRFDHTSSHAFTHGYLGRPIVDEWLYIVGQIVGKKWPGIELRKHRSRIQMSHDVDRPFQYLYLPARSMCRQAFGDLLKRKDLKLAIERWQTWRAVRRGEIRRDPFNTFDWLMEQSEQRGLSSAFYFICGRTNSAMDADYEIEDPPMRELLRDIHRRGHEIGLHPSYETFENPALIDEEFSLLRRVCEEEGVSQEAWGARMHYLRWAQPATMRGLSEAGLAYDTSLGYAAQAGFRCGTCHSYPAFDAGGNKQLPMRVVPLIIMDQQLSASKGSSDNNGVVAKVIELHRVVDRVGGVLTILWHNSSLVEDKRLYSSLLDGVYGQ